MQEVKRVGLAYVDLRGFPDVLSAGNYASLLKTGLQVSAWCTSPNGNMFVAKVIALDVCSCNFGEVMSGARRRDGVCQWHMPMAYAIRSVVSDRSSADIHSAQSLSGSASTPWHTRHSRPQSESASVHKRKYHEYCARRNSPETAL